VLVEVRRGTVVESRHRGHIVQVNAKGEVQWGIGDPDVLVTLRSAVKPFGVAALVEGGGVEAYNLTDQELAVMSASHTGEDAHVRTLQAVFRRAGISQSLLACGSEGAPLDSLTRARLARDGETPGPIRHMCSGFHSSSLLLSRIKGWSLPDYWRPEHPSQVAVRDVVARIFDTKPAALVTAVDACGVPTYAFPLATIARGFGLLAEPETATTAGQKALAPSLSRIRDAMVAAPDMVGGTRDSTDSLLMRTRPRELVIKGGAEGLRGIGIFPGARAADAGSAGLALKIEDGNLGARALRAASVEALSQLGALDAATLERLRETHQPSLRDPRGVEVGQVVPIFQLAPLSELG
jgi:L-asparaginase II